MTQKFKVHFILGDTSGSAVVTARNTNEAAGQVRRDFPGAKVKKVKRWRKPATETDKNVLNCVDEPAISNSQQI